jgi:hypothetical protein
MSIDENGPPRRFGSLAKAAPVEVQVRHGRQNQPFRAAAGTDRPAPVRVELADVLGTAAVEAIRAGGQLTFHVAGDTGGTKDTWAPPTAHADRRDLGRDQPTVSVRKIDQELRVVRQLRGPLSRRIRRAGRG